MLHRNKKITIGKRKTLVENLLLIEGITRAGKFLLANLMPALNGIEPVQYHGLLEEIPFLEKFGFIDRKTAQEIIRCEIDLHTYDMLIGRNLNHRKSDKSSIFNNPKSETYLARTDEPDGDAAVQRFQKQNPYCLYIAHELMPNIGIYFDAFPRMKVLSLQRSPLDLVYSWYHRGGHGHRWSDDPKIFVMVLASPHGPIPWFSAEWKKNYYKLSEIDRIIMAMETLVGKGNMTYKNLSARHKKQILFVCYEDILEHPDPVIKKIGKFLKKTPSKQLKKILASEKLPNTIDPAAKNQRLKEIQEHASRNMFRKLLIMEKEYLSQLKKS